MPLQATSGAASYDAFGGGVPVAINYIEEVFSTFLYAGTGAAQTITNGIDLSTNGGLVWIKGRSGATSHRLTDTTRGVTKSLASNSASSQLTESTGLTAFGTTGFTIGDDTDYNTSASTYVSWSLRKQTKFFEIVTWSGDSIYPRTITHNLGSAAGCIITKNTTESSDWFTYHRSLGNFQAIRLNTTATPFVSSNNLWNSTSTSFTLTADLGMNESASTYVAYLFAHDAGGFGLTGTDNVISCGSYVGNGMTAGPQVTLGYEPQWVLRKNITAARGGPSTAGSWSLVDNMRGMSQTTCPFLFANSSAAEDTSTVTTGYIIPNATGFVDTYTYPDDTYIYIAIRRGPMKVPTSGAEVFTPVLGRSANPNYLAGFPVDLGISEYRVNGSNSTGSRLQGSNSMNTASTGAEASDGSLKWDFMNGYYTGGRTTDFVSWAFRRAPSFFDEVCYTGNDVLRTINHNLGVAPEMMIIKNRDSALDWAVYHVGMGNTKYIWLNRTDAALTSSTYWNDTSPTSSVFTINTTNKVNSAPSPYVAYLFSTCAGVSKVGTYTGTATTKQIDCGFTAGARFVLIKRTDSTGDWFVWDSARGIVSGNDPYLLLNSTAAEVTNTDYIDTYSAGFEISSTAPAAINASGGTYIFLAIA